MVLHSPGGQVRCLVSGACGTIAHSSYLLMCMKLRAAELSLLGTKPVETESDDDVFPSDHFGLLARYETHFGPT